MNSALLKRIDGFLFAPASPLSLAVLRMIFFGWLLIWYWDFDFDLIALLPRNCWHPLFVLKVTGLAEFPSMQVLAVLGVTWKVLLACSCLGFLTRPSILLSAVIGTYLLATTHSFGKINHSDGALIVAMFVFGLGRMGDRLSVDALLWRREATRRVDSSGEYNWPIQIVRVLLVVGFFNAGVSKLVIGGIPWMTSDNLYGMLLEAQIHRPPRIHLDLSLAKYGLLCKLLAAGTVLIELAAPLALFWRRAAAVIIPSLLGMQVGIFLLMGDDFSQFAALYLCWLPWRSLEPWLARWFGGPSDHVAGRSGSAREEAAQELLTTCDQANRGKSDSSGSR